MTQEGGPTKSRKVDDTVPFDYIGRITTQTWDVDVLRRHIKAWPVLTKEQQHERVRQLDDELAETTSTTHNIPLDGLLGFIAKGLNPLSSQAAEASHLALGTSTTDPDPTNTTLGNEVYRTIVGDADVDGSDLLTSTFLSQAEANGYTLTEVGLAGGTQASAEPLLTHALFATGDEINKNSAMVVIIDYVLEIRRPA